MEAGEMLALDQKERHTMRPGRALIPLIIAYLLYGLSLTVMSHAGFPRDMQSGLRFPYLADKPVGEDGYYMLTVAWNMAQGHGIVYNYNMPTTGVQPLSTVLYAVVARIVQLFGGDKFFLIRSILLLGSINLLLFGHIVGTIVAKLTDPQVKGLGYAFGFVAVVFNFALFRLFTYGLETGIYLTCLAACILYTFSLPPNGKLGLQGAIALGALAGVTAWARIDFGVIFFVFLVTALVRHQLKLVWVVVTGMIATLIISPWFLYIFAATHSLLPSSGAAQAGLMTARVAPDRLRMMGEAILSHLAPWVYSGAQRVFPLAASLSFAGFLAFALRRKAFVLLLASKLKQQPYLTTWLAGTLALVPVYIAFFWDAHFYQRYSAPILVPLTLVMALTVTEGVRAMSAAVRLVALYALPVCFFGWAILSLHTGRIGNAHAVTAGFVRTRLGGLKVGAFQSGVVGYFNPNVINLDGKVNQTALSYAKDKRLDAYIESERIDVLVDWPNYIYSALDSSWLASNWDTCEEQVLNGATICLERKIPAAKRRASR